MINFQQTLFKKLEADHPGIEFVLEGGGRRFRAMILTSISTVGGLMPLILETSQHARQLSFRSGLCHHLDPGADSLSFDHYK